MDARKNCLFWKGLPALGGVKMGVSVSLVCDVAARSSNPAAPVSIVPTNRYDAPRNGSHAAGHRRHLHRLSSRLPLCADGTLTLCTNESPPRSSSRCLTLLRARTAKCSDSRTQFDDTMASRGCRCIHSTRQATRWRCTRSISTHRATSASTHGASAPVPRKCAADGGADG